MTDKVAATAPNRSGVLYLYRELWRFVAGQRLALLGAFTLLITAQVLLLAIPWACARRVRGCS